MAWKISSSGDVSFPDKVRLPKSACHGVGGILPHTSQTHTSLYPVGYGCLCCHCGIRLCLHVLESCGDFCFCLCFHLPRSGTTNFSTVLCLQHTQHLRSLKVAIISMWWFYQIHLFLNTPYTQEILSVSLSLIALFSHQKTQHLKSIVFKGVQC